MPTPSIVLEELIRFRKAKNTDTAGLSDLNHDELCIKVSDQINIILGSFEKYENISYLVQGPRDYGVDVLLKQTKEDEPETYIAIQIKSYREVDDKKMTCQRA